MKRSFVQPLIDKHGWTADPVTLESGDKTMKATIYKRESRSELTYNDTFIALEVDGDVQIYRQSSYRPVQMVLSGKAPPA